jgi:hypothetical protein
MCRVAIIVSIFRRKTFQNCGCRGTFKNRRLILRTRVLKGLKEQRKSLDKAISSTDARSDRSTRFSFSLSSKQLVSASRDQRREFTDTHDAGMGSIFCTCRKPHCSAQEPKFISIGVFSLANSDCSLQHPRFFPHGPRYQLLSERVRDRYVKVSDRFNKT